MGEHLTVFDQNSDEGRARDQMTDTERQMDFDQNPDEHGPRHRMTCNGNEAEFEQNPNGEGPDNYMDLTETLGHLQHLSSVFRLSTSRAQQNHHFAGRGRVNRSTEAPSSSDRISSHTLDHSNSGGRNKLIPR